MRSLPFSKLVRLPLWKMRQLRAKPWPDKQIVHCERGLIGIPGSCALRNNAITRSCQAILALERRKLMAKRALIVLAITAFYGAVCPAARAQAVAESAIMHANSGMSGSVARALGGNIQQGLAKTQSQFSYPPRTSHSSRHARVYRAKSRKQLAGRSPIAISSVVGGSALCTSTASPQAKPTGSPSANCGAKTAAPAATAKSNPNEITVSF